MFKVFESPSLTTKNITWCWSLLYLDLENNIWKKNVFAPTRWVLGSVPVNLKGCIKMKMIHQILIIYRFVIFLVVGSPELRDWTCQENFICREIQPVVDTNEDDIFIRIQILSDLRLPVIHWGHEVIVKNQLISQILNYVFEEP